jgi:hypothetical protein
MMAETFSGQPAEFLQLRSRVRAAVLDLHLMSRPHAEPTLLVAETNAPTPTPETR